MTSWRSHGDGKLHRPSGVLVATTVGVGIVMGWLSPALFATGRDVQRSWLILPAVVAAARFGLRGAAVASLASALAVGPLAGVVPDAPRSSGAAWLADGMFLVVVSCLVGALVDRIRRSDARVVEVLEMQRRLAVQAAEERGALSHELSRRVHEDVLTGLANRSAFVDKLRQSLEGRHPLAVLFVDLDDFKTVNDTLGHGVGDELLASVAERLKHGSRGDDLVARFGGDEFAVLLWNLSPADALHVGQRMLSQLKAPFELRGRTVRVKASGGLAVTDGDASGDNEERALDLMRQADLAMYANKAQHAQGITMFHSGMHSEMVERLSLESDLHRALGTEELTVVFQPILDLGSGDIVAVEALLRWNHPSRGALAPSSFIPVAEQTGMIVPLTLWVVREACAQLQEWDEHPGTQGLSVAVNISARLVLEPGIGSAIARELYHAGIDPHRIVLEITESLLMEEHSDAVQTLYQLRALGMRLSVDDFGTGYSSLSRLNMLPIDEVKIDQSFIAQLTRSDAGDTIVRATVAMAHGLGLRVVAEGVETPAQLAALRAFGCDEAQGYLLGRPVAAAEVPAVIARRVATRSTLAELPAAREDSPSCQRVSSM